MPRAKDKKAKPDKPRKSDKLNKSDKIDKSDKFRWDDTMYARCSDMARAGMSDAEIAGAIGCPPASFSALTRSRKALAKTLSAARASAAGFDHKDYVFGRLPPRLQLVWEELAELENQGGGDKVEALLRTNGLRARQHLWLHALSQSNYNPTEACRRLNVTRREARSWAAGDPGFQELCDSLYEAESDFVKGALLAAVARGDTSAIVHAHKCYSQAAKAQGQSNLGAGVNLHLHADLPLEELLTPEERLALLARIRDRRPPPKQITGTDDYEGPNP